MLFLITVLDDEDYYCAYRFGDMYRLFFFLSLSYGVVFEGQNNGQLTVKVQGKTKFFTLLQVLEFDSGEFGWALILYVRVMTSMATEYQNHAC